MGRLLIAEYRKTRRRYILLVMLGMTAVELFWTLHGDLSEDAILKGWMMLLYELPLINALFMPILAVVISSQLGDLEHKGGMLKELCCITERGKLYDAKLLYGSALIFSSIVLQFAVILWFGHRKHFGGKLPVKEYLLLFLFTVTVTGFLYLLQHGLAMCCKKTAVPYLVGVIGEFVGVFSMFLPQFPALRRCVPWGYYGVMMFVGSEYDRATRISTYYMLDIDWGGFCLMILWSLLLYLAGKRVFCKMDL